MASGADIDSQTTRYVQTPFARPNGRCAIFNPEVVLTMVQHPSKRPRPNVGSALRRGPPGPDFAKGVKYWDEIDATVDGMLGGFGTGVSCSLRGLN